ncbi:MAG: DMT family transporter [Candidatus Aminicenantes bacterium]|nr:DMT family transporter [Candidatus Aminicenantes bacterium]
MNAAELGEILAVVSAVFWAAAIILFRVIGQKVAPLGLNLFKTIMGLVLFLVTMILVGEPILRRAPLEDCLLLLASGLLGIALSDTLFFYSLNLLGAGRASIVATLYSPFIIGLSLAFLGERLNGRQVVGVGLIFSAVLIIAYHKESRSVRVGSFVSGVALGVLAQLTTALGIVMIKPLLGRTPVLWATALRLAGAIPALGLILAFHSQRKSIYSSLMKRAHWKVLIPASFLGTYLAIVAWMGAMKYAQASVAAALNQTSTAFTFILAAIFLKEKPTAVKTAAVLLALLGALLISSL